MLGETHEMKGCICFQFRRELDCDVSREAGQVQRGMHAPLGQTEPASILCS